MERLKSALRRQITDVTAPKIIGYNQEEQALYDIIKRSATLGESNSLLLVGPHGSGKTMLLRSVIDKLKNDKTVANNLCEVHLNGLLDTDDKLALREITKQLQLENTVENKVFSSFAENLQFLLQSLRQGDKSSKSILFVLEEFDLFSYHKNQSLLYNLFDMAQSAAAPICVVGLTVRLDVLELLEKRVKSRFSHRQIYLFPSYTVEQYVMLFETYLTAPKAAGSAGLVSRFNKHVHHLSEKVEVVELLQRQLQLNKGIRSLLKTLFTAIGNLSESKQEFTVFDFIDSHEQLNVHAEALMLRGSFVPSGEDLEPLSLPGLSVLELCLVVAMRNLTELYEGEPFNFEMVFAEYRRFAQKSNSHGFDKAVCMKAFEHLSSLEIIGTIDSNSQKEYRLMQLKVDTALVKESIKNYANCPTDVRMWATQESMAA